MPQGLPFHLKEYIEPVNLTRRVTRENKRGYIDNNLPPILDRLTITSQEWLVPTTQFESKFKSLVGCKEKLIRAAKALNLKRRPAYSNCKAIFH